MIKFVQINTCIDGIRDYVKRMKTFMGCELLRKIADKKLSLCDLIKSHVRKNKRGEDLTKESMYEKVL